MTERIHQLRPDTFEAFYQASWREVYRPLAAIIGDRELAREAVDEAMVRAFAHWSSVRSMDNREGWVYRVAHRWAIDRLRRRQVERRTGPRMAERPAVSDVAVEPRLEAALAALSPEQRAVVVLSSVFEWQHSEIAAALGIRAGTVKSRLSRGLDHLRKELGV